MDVEGLTAKLQRGRQSPSQAGSKTPAVTSINSLESNGAAIVHEDPNKSSLDQTADQANASKDAMEEIWNKLGPAKEQVHVATNNEIVSLDNDDVKAPELEPVANGISSNDGAAECKDDSSEHAINGIDADPSHAQNGKSAASGLNAVSEPAPLPIPSTARLSPSPAHTPEVEAAESGETDKMNTGTMEPQHTHVNGTPAPISKQDSVPIQHQPTPEELLAEKKQKLALWNELKITAFSRTITTLYSLVLLSLQTHIQLNLLGRYAYLTSVVSLSAPASSTNHRIRLERHDGKELDADLESTLLRDDDELAGGIDVQTERLYLTFSWWFLHQGWKELADNVKDAVQDVFGGLALKTQLTHQDFLLLLNKVRRRVEYEAKDDMADTADGRSEYSEATATTIAHRRGKRKTFLSILFPPTSQEVWVLEKAGAISSDPTVKTISQLSPQLGPLLDETKDLLESKDFSRILRLCLNRVFQVFEATLRPTFGVEPIMTSAEVDGLLRQSSAVAARALGDSTGSSSGRFQQLTEDEQVGIRVRLASLFPAVARQSSAAINGVPNEYVEALTEIKELKAFSAVIYSSWT